jgi:hypothetical protein
MNLAARLATFLSDVAVAHNRGHRRARVRARAVTETTAATRAASEADYDACRRDHPARHRLDTGQVPPRSLRTARVQANAATLIALGIADEHLTEWDRDYVWDDQ